MPRRLLWTGVLAVLTSAVQLYSLVQAREPPSQKEASTNSMLFADHEIISDVIIHGSKRLRAEQMKAHLRTQPGKEYDPATVADDVRDLYKRQPLSYIADFVRRDGPGRVKVFFLIDDLEKNVQKVTFQGAAHVREEELRKITELHPGIPLNPSLNRWGCRKIEEKYREIGRPFSTCTLVKGGDVRDSEVVYKITEGPETIIRDIQFPGNSFVPDAQLATKIRSSRRWLHSYSTGSYNPVPAEMDVYRLITFYKIFGYQDVAVSLETQHFSDGGEVVLIYHIKEGPRYRIESAPEIIGSNSLPQERLKALLQVKAGDYFTETYITDDVRRIETYCESLHRPVHVEAIPVWLKTQPGVATIRFQVTERNPPEEQERSEPPASVPQDQDDFRRQQADKLPPTRIGQIFIQGNKEVSQYSILAHVPLFPGQILKYSDLRQAEKDLAKLGIFVVDPAKGIQPTITVIDAGEDNPFKDIRITVKEKPQAKDPGSKP